MTTYVVTGGEPVLGYDVGDTFDDELTEDEAAFYIAAGAVRIVDTWEDDDGVISSTLERTVPYPDERPPPLPDLITAPEEEELT